MKIALIQFAGKRDKTANLARATELVEQAASRGADVVCLHELATTVYFAFEERDRWFELAEPIPGPATEHFGALARKRSLALVLPLFERGDDGLYYNSAAVLDTDGALLGTYRKSIIPFVCRGGTTPSTFERYYFQPGNHGLPVFRTS